MSVDIILKDIEWDGVNKIRVPLEGGGTQDFSIGGGSANLQTKSKTYTPTTSQQTDQITSDAGYDGMDKVNVTVNAVPSGVFDDMTVAVDNGMTVSVSSGGLITASVESTFSNQHPVDTAGYFDTSDTIDVAVEGTKTNQLPTQAGATITPTTSQQTAVTSGKYTTGTIIVDAIPSQYIVPSGTTTLGSNTMSGSGYLVKSYERAIVNVCLEFDIDSNDNVTCNRTWQECYEAITDDAYDGIVKYSGAVFGASAYGMDTNTGELYFVAFQTPSNGVCSPLFDVFYPYNGTPYKVSPSHIIGAEGTPTATKGSVSNHSVTVTPSVTNSAGYIQGGTKTGNSVTVTANELASGNLPITANADNINVVGYASVSVNVPGSTPNLQTKTRTYTPSITEQREVISADSGYDGLLAVGITVDPMPTLTLPNVASMSSTGTRKAKIYQSNYTQYWNIGTGYHAVAEYYEIPPLLVDTKTITTNGTYNAIDDDLDGYSSVTVNVPSGTPTLQTKSATYTPTTSQQTDTITPDTGYDGLDEVDITINAVPTGSVTMPSSISTSGGTTHYTTHNTLVITASATATPNVTTAGYISAGTSGATTLLVNTNIPTISTATITPATTDQTIPDNRYILGTQTIKAVTTNNIIASNIKSGVTVEVGDTDDPDRILSVTGTYSGGTSTCDTKTMTNDDSQATSIQFTGLSGEPKWFFVRCTSQLSRSSSYSYYFVTDIRYNGTNHDGNYYRRSNGTYYNDTSHYSHTYSNGTLTVSSSANRGAAGGSFYNGNYELVYIY